MRGAITMFLAWLFWEKGGMEYDASNPDAIIDKGGVSFLKALINSDGAGWENIGKIAGSKTDSLFEKMNAEINYSRINISGHQYIVDIATGEPVELFPGINYGELTIDFPKQYDLYQTTDINLWSVAFFEPFDIDNAEIITLLSAYQTGEVFFTSALQLP